MVSDFFLLNHSLSFTSPKITGNSSLNLLAISLYFLKMAGITSDLAKKSGDPPNRVSRVTLDNFCRDNIDGPHDTYLPKYLNELIFLSLMYFSYHFTN